MRFLNVTQFVGLLLLVGGCHGVVRTEGASGPIAWRVTDLAVVTRDVQGQAVDSTAFTLEIRNVSDRTVTFTKIDRTVYRPGTSPGSTSSTGRWELRTDGVWKIPLSSSVTCKYRGGCSGRGGTQTLWQVLVTGYDDQNRPVEVRLDITLPPLAVGRTPVLR